MLFASFRIVFDSTLPITMHYIRRKGHKTKVFFQRLRKLSPLGRADSRAQKRVTRTARTLHYRQLPCTTSADYQQILA